MRVVFQKVGTTDFDFITLDQRSAFILWDERLPGEASGYLNAINLNAFKH